MQKKIKLILILIVVITAVILLWFYYIQWQSFKQESVRKERADYAGTIVSSITDFGHITNIMPPHTIVLSLNKFGTKTIEIIEIDESTEILTGILGLVCNNYPCPESSFDIISFNDLKVGQEVAIDRRLDNLSKLKIKRIIHLRLR